MANSSSLNSYILECARKYAKNHPEEHIRATKRVEISLEACPYCETGEDIANIPFALEVTISKKHLIIDIETDKWAIPIDYCPICGKKLD